MDAADQSGMFTGGCLCGAVRFSCSQQPSLVSYCHCRMCQKQTGGLFSVMANFPRAAVMWSGKERILRRSSPLAVRGFCGDCGTPLSFQYEDAEHTSVSVGALEHPERVRPTQHGGIESRIAWVANRSTRVRKPIRPIVRDRRAAPAVPEPGTWALMILGFGVVGYAMRRRPSVRFAQAI